jgi:hypothetical protein
VRSTVSRSRYWQRDPTLHEGNGPFFRQRKKQ